MHRDDPRGPSPLRYLLAGLAMGALAAAGTAAAVALTGSRPHHIVIAYIVMLAAGAGVGLTLGLRARRRNWRNQ